MFQTIQFSIGMILIYKQSNVKTVQLNVKTVLFQTIQFSIRTQFFSIWPIDTTLSGTTTLGQSWPGSIGILHSPKLQHYWSLTIRLYSVISRTLVQGVLPLCRDALSIFCSSSWLGHENQKISFVHEHVW